jgi:hypothetical protein
VSSLNRVQLKFRSLIFCRNNFEMTEMKTLPRTTLPQAAQAVGHAVGFEAQRKPTPKQTKGRKASTASTGSFSGAQP